MTEDKTKEKIKISKNGNDPKKGRPRLLLNELSDKDVIEALMETGGRLRETCEILNICIPSFYKNFRYKPEIEEALKKARQIGFELVTDTLISQAMKGDMRAAALYLKYNPEAKANGWIENQTITLKPEKPLTEEEKEDLKRELFG